MHNKLIHKNYNIIPSQSDEGKVILDYHKLTKISQQSIILIIDKNIFTKSDAMLKMIDDFPLYWKVLKIFKIIPKAQRDFIYSWISNNRHLLIGKKNKITL